MNPGSALLRLRATIVPYNAESAQLPIHLPVTLDTLSFPTQIDVNLQSFWRDAAADQAITCRFLRDDATPFLPEVQVPLEKQGAEWYAAHVQPLLFEAPAAVSIVIELDGREVERRRIELVHGRGTPYRP